MQEKEEGIETIYSVNYYKVVGKDKDNPIFMMVLEQGNRKLSYILKRDGARWVLKPGLYENLYYGYNDVTITPITTDEVDAESNIRKTKFM